VKKLRIFVAILLISFVAFTGFSQTIEEQLDTVTADLIALTDEYSNLLDEYSILLTQLEETTQALVDSNETLTNTNTEFINSQDIFIDTQSELIVAQKEIVTLRKEVEGSVVVPDSLLQLGIGYTYPNGAEILLNMDIPFFPIGIYGRANIQFDNSFNLGIGLTIDL